MIYAILNTFISIMSFYTADTEIKLKKEKGQKFSRYKFSSYGPKASQYTKNFVGNQTGTMSDSQQVTIATLDLVETEEDIIGEKENFAYNDEDKDGSLNRAEVLKWVSPDMKGVAGEEASHLIQETDSDKDGAVTLEEIYAESDLWVGSEASDVVMTDWEHDELQGYVPQYQQNLLIFNSNIHQRQLLMEFSILFRQKKTNS